MISVADTGMLLHELTMLYLEKSDISGLTPEELFIKYQEVFKKIDQAKGEKASKTIEERGGILSF